MKFRTALFAVLALVGLLFGSSNLMAAPMDGPDQVLQVDVADPGTPDLDTADATMKFLDTAAYGTAVESRSIWAAEAEFGVETAAPLAMLASHDVDLPDKVPITTA